MRKAIILLFLVLAVAAVARGRRFRFRFGIKARLSHRLSHRIRASHRVASHALSQFSHITQTLTGGGSNIVQDYKKDVKCSGHCLPNTAFLKDDHCECKAGLAGVGDLCCTDPTEYEYNCVVRGDPYLTSSLGQKVQIFNPCGQKLAVIAGRTTSGTETCRVTVRTADVIEDGVFITNQVELTYEIGSSQKEYVFLNGYKYYHTKEMTSSTHISWLGLGATNKGCVEVENENIYVSQDECRKVWTVSACGTIINFRRNINGGKPGVCISSKYQNSVQTGDAQCVCNKLPKQTYTGFETEAFFYLAKSFETQEYLNLKLSCYTDSCKTITNTYNNCPADRRVKAINKCGSILRAKFRACSYLFGGIDGVQLFKLFNECVDAFCGCNQKWCMDVKETTALLQCPLHEVNCCDFKKHDKKHPQPLTQEVIMA